ncbi:hypothetical protein [Streptomyces lydicus]|uniref:hypothetical protein n=1 Tax=Streptomyces lydicus TaxID=47763 RepID=UPI0037232606
MTKPLYTPEGEADTQLEHLGYNASVHDLLVQAAHRELNRFLEHEGEAVKMWGWDPNSLRAADRYRIAQLLRSFIYQEQRIVAALCWLDEQYRAYLDSSPQARAQAEAFITSLNEAAARRAVDEQLHEPPWSYEDSSYSTDGSPVDDEELLDPGEVSAYFTDDKRDRLAKDVVAKWQQNARYVDAHTSRPWHRPAKGDPWRSSEMLVDSVIADHLQGTPELVRVAEDLNERISSRGLEWRKAFGIEPLKPIAGAAKYVAGIVKDAAGITTGAAQPVEYAAEEIVAKLYEVEGIGLANRYPSPAFRRIHALRSIIDFHDPEIARELGWRSDMGDSMPEDHQGKERPEDTSFKGSGLGTELWRLKDVGYPRHRIPDGELYDLVDTVLAVQAEYQLQCFFVDRELAKIIDTRGKEEQWLYQKTAEWAEERAKAKARAIAYWGFVGDILGLVSAAAGVLALIPVLAPIMAPIAIVTAVASLGAHAAAASIAGDWDANTIAGLGADALAAIPAIGAVAKGAKGAWAAARMNKVANVIVNTGGQAFLGAIGIGAAGKGASDAAKVFDYLGKKGSQNVGGTVRQGQIAGKVLQGAVTMITQVPLVVELSSGSSVDQKAKDAATGTALIANLGQTVGEWDLVGAYVKKAGTISIKRFSAFFR